MSTLTREEQATVKRLFDEYKALATEIGLLDEMGRIQFNIDYHKGIFDKIKQDTLDGETARTEVLESYENERPIYKKLESLRNEIDRITKKEA